MPTTGLAAPEPAYVSEDRVLLRSTGTPEGEVVDALPWATAVMVLSEPTADRYVEIRVDGTKVTGFVPESLLTATRPVGQAPQSLGSEFCGGPVDFVPRIDATTECPGFRLNDLAPKWGELERAFEQSDLSRRKLLWSLALGNDSVYAKHATTEVLNASPLFAPVPTAAYVNAEPPNFDHAQIFDSAELREPKQAPPSMWLLGVDPKGGRLDLSGEALPARPVALGPDRVTVIFEQPLTAFIFNPCEASFTEQLLTDIRYSTATGVTSAATADPTVVARLATCKATAPAQRGWAFDELIHPRLDDVSFFLAVDQSPGQELARSLRSPLANKRTGITEGSVSFAEATYVLDGKARAFVREVRWIECADEQHLDLQFSANGTWMRLSSSADTGCEP